MDSWMKGTAVGGVSGFTTSTLGMIGGGTLLGNFSAGIVASFATQTAEHALGLRDEYSVLGMLTGGATNVLGGVLQNKVNSLFSNRKGQIRCDLTQTFAQKAVYYGSQTAAGGAIGMGTNALEQVIRGEPFDVDEMLQAGAISALTGTASARTQMQGRVCFAAGTPLQWEHGAKAIELFAVGNRIWSRDENDPDGAVTLRRVLQVFVRSGLVFNLHVQGQVIGTTAEHPFYVRGRGWTAAHELRIGDEIALMTPGWVRVDGLAASGRFETVYNLEIESDHTYFVGCDEWGFSVWAHNAYDVQSRHWGSTADGIRLRTAAREFRATHPDGLNRGRNIATADVVVDGRQTTVRFINDRHGMHSEQRLIAWHELQTQRGRQVEVLRVNTERMPCGPGQANCREVLGRRYGSDLEVFHSQGTGSLTNATMNGG